MKIWIHIKTQLHILFRYMSMLFLIVAISLAIGMLVSIMYDHRQLFNIPLVIVIGSSFMGPGLGDSFSGKREYTNYCLAPWSIRTVILSKCVVWMLVMIIVPVLLLFGSSFFIEGSFYEYKSAILFWITSIPVFLIMGTRISVIPRDNSTVESDNSLYLLMSLTIPIAVIPYFLFHVMLDSVILCVIFSVFLFFVWYNYILPDVIKKIKNQNYNLEHK